MRYKYKVKEIGTEKPTEMEAMSLKKLKTKLDHKKEYHIEYINKKGNFISIITNGKDSS